ncbi:MAG: M20/M25/M40 family metallo-hydrolase [Actinomycetota bacterium]
MSLSSGRAPAVFAVVVALAVSAWTPPGVAQLSTTPTHGYLTDLFDIGWRRAGSPSAAAAAVYIKDHLEPLGYQTEVQEFEFPYFEVTEKSLTLDGARYEIDEIMYSGSTTAGGITAEVVELDSADIAGKIALIPFPQANPGWKNLSNTLKSDYARAVAEGAVAVIAEAPDRLYAASVSKATWTPGAIPGVVALGARALIGKEPTLVLRSKVVSGIGRNVVAHRAGAGAETILVLAHYDAWFGGAADNASGTAALLRAAELLSEDPLQRGVTFLAVDGEELGLLGSQAFIADRDLSEIVGVVNLDMVSAKPSDVYEDAPGFQWRVVMTSETPPLMASAEANAALNQVVHGPLSATLWEDGYGAFRTDYEWFYYQGVPGTWVISEAAYYHTTEDKPDHVDPADLENVSHMVAGVVRDMQTMLLPRVTHLDVDARMDAGTVTATVGLAGRPRDGATVTVVGYRGRAEVSRSQVTAGEAGTYTAELPPNAEYVRVHAAWNTLDGEAWLPVGD